MWYVIEDMTNLDSLTNNYEITILWYVIGDVTNLDSLSNNHEITILWYVIGYMKKFRFSEQ